MLIGRFTVALRDLVPGLGMARMPYRRFATFNVAGAVLWGGLVVLVGYLAGNSWQRVGHFISNVGVDITAGVVAALVVAHVIGRRRRREHTSRDLAGQRGGSTLTLR